MTRLSSALLTVALLGFAAADNCKFLGNLHYCNSVQAITYENIGFDGTYQEVVNYNKDACTCESAPKGFSGALAPLDEQLSLSFRGPLEIKKVAVYVPKPPTKRSVHDHLKRHGHHAHQRRAMEIVTKKVTKTVVVDQTGATLVPAPGSVKEDVGAALVGIPDADNHKVPTPGNPDIPKIPKTPKAPEEVNDDGDEWVRKGYYDSVAQVQEGLIFMNYNGGNGSGVWDTCIGNSLSYADAEGRYASEKPTVLADRRLLSNEELILFSDEPCDESCGYYRPGIPAHKGFGGKNKIFMFEFSMPAHTDSPNPFNLNLPAIWSLNAKITRMAQYGKQAGGDGNKSCSCWPECGELDLFEVIAGAPDYIKTHYHSKQGAAIGGGGGGSADYFDRPFDKHMKAAVIFDGTKAVTITFLPDDTDFSEYISNDFVGKCAKKTLKSIAASVFNVPL